MLLRVLNLVKSLRLLLQVIVDVILRLSSGSPKQFFVEIDSISEGQSFWTKGDGWYEFDDYLWTVALWSGSHNLRVKFLEGSIDLCSISVMLKYL